jgi:hypothetical protein
MRWPNGRRSDAAGISDTRTERSDTPSATGNGPQLTSGVRASRSTANSGNRHVKPGAAVGTVIWLVALGAVAITTVAAFFGVGFLLLVAPSEEMQAPRMGTHEATPIPPKRTAAPRVATLTPPDRTAAPRVATMIPPDRTALALEFHIWLSQNLHRANLAPRKQAFAPREATLTPPEQALAPRWATSTPPNQAFVPREATLTPPAETSPPREAMPNYLASPSGVALSASPRLSAANERYRDARVRFLRQQQARLELQLTKPNLTAMEMRRLERQKAYWGHAIEQMGCDAAQPLLPCARR